METKYIFEKEKAFTEITNLLQVIGFSNTVLNKETVSISIESQGGGKIVVEVMQGDYSKNDRGLKIDKEICTEMFKLVKNYDDFHFLISIDRLFKEGSITTNFVYKQEGKEKVFTELLNSLNFLEQDKRITSIYIDNFTYLGEKNTNWIKFSVSYNGNYDKEREWFRIDKEIYTGIIKLAEKFNTCKVEIVRSITEKENKEVKYIKGRIYVGDNKLELYLDEKGQYKLLVADSYIPIERLHIEGKGGGYEEAKKELLESLKDNHFASALHQKERSFSYSREL
ncbi:MAG: hypothetical protein ACP5H3_04095 [Candidatus Aenigmatarchaeota archaeon]